MIVKKKGFTNSTTNFARHYYVVQPHTIVFKRGCCAFEISSPSSPLSVWGSLIVENLKVSNQTFPDPRKRT
jgi:hypothetical protein